MCQGHFTFLMSLPQSGRKDGQICSTHWVPRMKHSLQRGGVVATVMALLMLKLPSIQKLVFSYHYFTKFENRLFSEVVDSLCAAVWRRSLINQLLMLYRSIIGW